MIPAYLMSPCADRSSDFCSGCDESVKQHPETGKWFITMGHPGFNSEPNNRDGYPSRDSARYAVSFFGSPQNRIEKGDTVILEKNKKLYVATGKPYLFRGAGSSLDGFMVVHYQAINPKTGKGWQRLRVVPVMSVTLIR